jgi:hypothetical protein
MNMQYNEWRGIYKNLSYRANQVFKKLQKIRPVEDAMFEYYELTAIESDDVTFSTYTSNGKLDYIFNAELLFMSDAELDETIEEELEIKRKEEHQRKLEEMAADQKERYELYLELKKEFDNV